MICALRADSRVLLAAPNLVPALVRRVLLVTVLLVALLVAASAVDGGPGHLVRHLEDARNAHAGCSAAPSQDPPVRQSLRPAQ
jgi:hypothetical protein